MHFIQIKMIGTRSFVKITSCTPNPLHCGGKGGCVGSIPQLAYSYVQLFGLTTEKEYPYWSGITMVAGQYAEKAQTIFY